jgi:hypothetical protein
MTHIDTKTNDASNRLTHADLAQFTGDLERYRHPLNRQVIYTPGVQYLAEKAHAYWLIDAIASYFGTEQMNDAIRNDSRLATLQFWRLTVSGDSAVLTAEADSGVKPFICQEIEFTDFPLDRIDIWAGYDGTYWTLYLPSEH